MNRAALIALTLGLGVLTGCGPSPHPTPLNQLNAAQTRGHAVFQAHCGVCHYDRDFGGLNGPSLASLYKKPALPSGAAATDERVTATILHGRGMMPAQGLSDDELSDLLAYLHTL